MPPAAPSFVACSEADLWGDSPVSIYDQLQALQISAAAMAMADHVRLLRLHGAFAKHCRPQSWPAASFSQMKLGLLFKLSLCLLEKLEAQRAHRFEVLEQDQPYPM